MVKTKRTILCAFAGLMLVLLWGCASTSERSSTRVLKVEGSALSHEQVGGTTSSSFRKQLPELTEGSMLNDYLAYAALNNPQMEAAFNRWKAALEMVTQVRTLPDPRFNYGYFIQEVETRVGPQHQRVGISQMFPWFGKLKLKGEIALEGANATQQQYEAVKFRLFDEVKQAYYELYYVGRAIAVTTENVDLLKQLEEIARSKYESGTAEYGDVIKAQVELDKLRDQLSTLQDFKQPLVARLNAALNRPAEMALPFPKNSPPRVLLPETSQLIKQMKSSNPELKILDLQTEQERSKIALAKKEFYPDVTVGLDYVDTGNARTPGVPDSGKDAVILGFSVNLPLWREKYSAGVREAENRYTAARLEREDRANRLSTDLKLAFFKYQNAERKIALYRDLLTPKADQNLKVIQRSFEAGKSSFLSLIDAERVLLEFQLTYERAVADREQGLATMEKLVGGEPQPLVPEKERKP